MLVYLQNPTIEQHLQIFSWDDVTNTGLWHMLSDKVLMSIYKGYRVVLVIVLYEPQTSEFHNHEVYRCSSLLDRFGRCRSGREGTSANCQPRVHH